MLISTFRYTRKDQQLRFAYLQSGQVIVVATGSIVNYGLNFLDHSFGLRGWQWMFIVQGAITMFIGIVTFLWIPDFPEKAAAKTRWFLSQDEANQVLAIIDRDRKDAGPPEPFTTSAILTPFLDIKLYAFSVLFFLQNVVSTALSYFIPTILIGMGFTSDDSILLYAPPYYWAVVPVIITSYIADRLTIRGPIIIFNALCLIVGMCMLGFPSNVAVRYVGVLFATGAYVSNWAALNAWQMNNVTGQCALRYTKILTDERCIIADMDHRYREASNGRCNCQWVQFLGRDRRLIYFPIERVAMVPNSYLGDCWKPHIDHSYCDCLRRVILASKSPGTEWQGNHRGRGRL